ncbi:hypothetical protein [Rhizobium sp. LjRoot254]|uniref:hypothetical protein n=1 Tax=Rhizobium sp. LjRoot254 TaxID=3342297 RepID=UPI003ECFD528
MAAKVVAVALLASALSNCTTSVKEAPKPEVQEPPINSLALEQCIGENGQEKCTGEGD